MTARRLTSFLTNAAAIAAAFVVAGNVAAHGGEMGLFIDPATAAPGAVIGVRGDLPTTDPVDLVLVDSAGTEVALARVEDPPNGHFDIQVTLPGDLPPGQWTMIARAPGMTPIASPMTIIGGAATGSEVASAAPDAAASAAPGAASPPAAVGPTADPAADGTIDPVPFASIALAVAALTLLFVRTRGRRAA